MKLIFLLGFLGFLGLCHGHARFVFPRPESGDSGIKSGPCSDLNRPFEDEYKDITPGPITIRWEETIPHITAETRITLNKHGDEENSCLLLDHIPHNENGRLVLGPDCQIYDWPVGRCVNPSFATVNIPDIECDECFLQIVSIMTDKYEGDDLPCVQESIAHNNCSSYYSCANVKIRPTSAGRGKDIDSCLNYYDNLVGDWPFRPSEDYVITLSHTPEVVSSARLDPHYSTVTFSIGLDALPKSVSDVGLRVYHAGGEPLQDIYPLAVEGDHLTGVWSQVPYAVKENFRNGLIEIALYNHLDTKEFESGVVSFEFENFEPGIYYGNGLDFTPAGWLPGDDFIGPNARYPFAVQPYGAYAEDLSRYFGAIIHDEFEAGAGVLSMTVTEDRGWIRAAFVTGSLSGTISGLTLSNYDSGFINRVQVVTSDSEDVYGEFREGLSAPLRNGLDHQGEAIVYIEEYGNLHYAFVVHSDEPIYDVSIRGPARHTQQGDYLLVTDFEYDDEQTEFFNEGTFPDQGVDVWDALWNDQAYFDVETESLQGMDRGVSGQISHPGYHYCSSIWDHTCFGEELTINGLDWPTGEPTVDTSAVGSYALKAGNLFEYRVTLRDVLPDEVVTSAAVTLTGDPMYVLSSDTQPSPREDKALIMQGVIENVSEAFIFSLERGYLELELRTSRYPDDTVEGFIPPIARQD